jgi:hypothetical protein
MRLSTYIIRYNVYDINDKLIKSEGEINCKNRASEIEAKVKLEEYLKKKYPTFGRLVIISCSEDIFGIGSMGDFTNDSSFMDIFETLLGKNKKR